MADIKPTKLSERCNATFMLALNDTLNVLSGKWKLHIMGALLDGKKRFTEIENSIPKINPRMLSKELKELEVNGIVLRTVRNTIPVAVEYELTKSGYSIGDVLEVMVEWGLQHRKLVMGKKTKAA